MLDYVRIKNFRIIIIIIIINGPSTMALVTALSFSGLVLHY